MTSIHAADVSRRLTDLLDRRQPPRSFAANEDAKANQIAAYLSILTRAAPAAPALEDWWARFLDALSDLSETWAWPSETDVRNACKAVNGPARRDQPGDAWKPDSAAINLARLRNGNPIGEDWLWGSGAMRLLAAGASREELRERRLSAAMRWAEVWTRDAVIAKLRDLRLRHEAAAEAVRDFQYRKPVDVFAVIPNKAAFSAGELEALI